MQFLSQSNPILPSDKRLVDQNLTPRNRRLLIVQYAGDVREAYYRLTRDGEETYYAQRYSVNVLSEYLEHCEEVATLIFKTQEAFDEVLPNGIRTIGAGFEDTAVNETQVLELVRGFRPTHLILVTPNLRLLKWAIKNRIRILVMIADSFQNKSFKARIWNYRFQRLVNDPWVDWVCNHGINACLSLKDIGVDLRKVIPWDWPAVIKPSDFAPKQHLATAAEVNLFFAGSISQSKGIGDVLNAVAVLKNRGWNVQLKIAGNGDIKRFRAEAERLGIEPNVCFLGLVPHHQVVHLMRAADVLLVPSRHDYPEGLPMTIYEGLCSRTPIVASDHPMFANRLQHNVNALIFPQADIDELANCIARLCSDHELYLRLSAASEAAWHNLQIQTKSGDLVKQWLKDSPASRQWFSERCLSAPAYRRYLMN